MEAEVEAVHQGLLDGDVDMVGWVGERCVGGVAWRGWWVAGGMVGF